MRAKNKKQPEVRKKQKIQPGLENNEGKNCYAWKLPAHKAGVCSHC
jgi:hypothetical protein